MDDNLFANIRHNPHHVLYKHLPDKTDHTHNPDHVRILFHKLSRLMAETI